jgi:CBS domain-containing protein
MNEDFLTRPLLLSVSPNASLFDACVVLRKYGIHRIPIIAEEQQLCLTVTTHLKILEYLVQKFREDRRLFDQSIFDLNIGTFIEKGGKICTVTPETPLLEVLELFNIEQVSCIPIIDSKTGRVLDIYARSYVIHLCKHPDFENLGNVPVADILRSQYEESGEKVLTFCLQTNSLHEVFLKFAESNVHRLIIVDSPENAKLLGICSLSDLFAYFID